ncbi:MAG: hypothetical protein COA57_12010 [Flavobacteriales bacterium]|nr:MAG: hypothetical protein COA57_12010 [Flavobacteriales bacterium]
MNYEQFVFYIFNRWGKLIYETNSMDGTYRGEQVQQDVYVWKLKVEENTVNRQAHENQGHVTLFR